MSIASCWKLSVAVAAAAVWIGAGTSHVWAQGGRPTVPGAPARPSAAGAAGHSHAEDAGHAGDHDGHNHGAEVLAYRLPQGHTLPFDDPKVAAQHLAAVQQLGCEAQQQPVGGRTNVIYRCKDWRTMTVATHELSVQWEGWLKGAGFDTFHGHVAEQFEQGAESIDFRLLDWKTVHAEGAQLAKVPQLLESLKNLGCEIQQDVHDDHADVTYRCPIWTEIHVADHAAAEQWLGWLKAQGFESKHED